MLGFATARDGGFARRAISPLLDLAENADAVVAGPGTHANDASEKLAGCLCTLGRPTLCWTQPYFMPCQTIRAKRAMQKFVRSCRRTQARWPVCWDAVCRSRSDPLGAGRACANRYASRVLVKGVQSHVVNTDGRA